MSLWRGLLEALGSILRFFHDITVGFAGEFSWALAIILLTVAVRVVLLPLAIKQFRSMQAMQQLRPEMKRIQQKYKTDRGMMRTDPDKYKERRQKQQEELMALYKERNVNPASSCLPLVAQMPIFIALFSVLRSPDVIPELADAPLIGSVRLQQLANEAGIVAIVMLVLMAATTYVQQKQMMGRNAVAADDQAMQQQKIMLYVMPVFLAVLGFNLPVGVLLYWVTTNLWQMGQQWFILREMEQSAAAAAGAAPSGGESTGSRGEGGQSKGKGATRGSTTKDTDKGRGKDPARGSGGKPSKKGGGTGDRPPRGSAKRSASKREEARRKSRKGNVSGNGHRPGGPRQIGKKRNETRDRRR